jgi:uroporphyrinogen decarboxylase
VLNNRELFCRLMNYEPLDRLPVLAVEPYEPEAIRRWHGEGLPAGADPVDFLGMSRLVEIPLSFHPIPAFEPLRVAEDELYYVEQSDMGALIRRSKDNPSMFYGHIDHPIKTRADWERYKLRFRAASPGRLPADWLTASLPRLRSSPDPVCLTIFPFFMRFGFYSMGMERFLAGFYEESELMHEVFDYVGKFVTASVRTVLDVCVPDVVRFTEDLAGKNGPLVSPRIYHEFWHPYQDPLIHLLQERGVPLICQWSAGQFDRLLPDMLAHGFNCTWPLEVMAGMDAARLRARFGRQLRLAGNIAKEAVIAGPAAIDQEIERLMPLICEGGFLPALDDMASPDMPWAHYRHLIERLQAIRLG